MTSNVYFTALEQSTETMEIQKISKRLLETVIEREKIKLASKIPLKVHFGEQKNVTFLCSENYLGIIDFLNERNIPSQYMETCVLYGGQRYKKELHAETARQHGFTQLPIVFADGDYGEQFAEVTIDKKHFQTFKIGKAFLDFEQFIIISHFKGHRLAGFGGAIKQLSMGHASKGGKMAMHIDEKPHIKNKKCTRCGLCTTQCNQGALLIADNKKKKSRIDHEKCVGCGACVAICPQKAVSIFSIKSIAKFLGIGNPFIEKLVEGAYAAQKGKRNIYINFAMNITPGCDCEARKMKPLMSDIGIFASNDPVAIDKACYDMVEERGKTFRGFKTFAYAEKIGLGTIRYHLHEIPIPRRKSPWFPDDKSTLSPTIQ